MKNERKLWKILLRSFSLVGWLLLFLLFPLRLVFPLSTYFLFSSFITYPPPFDTQQPKSLHILIRFFPPPFPNWGC